MFSADATTGSAAAAAGSAGAATCSVAGRAQLSSRRPLSPASAGKPLRTTALSGAQEYSTTKSLPHRGAGSRSRSTSTIYVQSERPLQLFATSLVALPDGAPQLPP